MAKPTPPAPSKRKQRLKVYRTPAGFYDAYIAAPSMKAALKAWGARGNLFDHEAAEIVTDPELMAEPLSRPGDVIRVPRVDKSEVLKPAAPGGMPKRAKTKAQPPPSRKSVDAATKALDLLDHEASQAIADVESRIWTLEVEHRKLRQTFAAKRRKLEAKLESARADYDAAHSRWSDSQK